ncbi:MAG: endonuclease III [Deltaproteobacteria bacterium]|nr:endonuclease III [Deltaproteobacteria bacterium]
MDKLVWIISRLESHYGKVRNRPDGDIIGQLVRTILSQNTNDTNRDRAYASLCNRFPSWEDVLLARPEELAAAIRVGGLANIKSSRIIQILQTIQKQNGVLNLDSLSRLSTEEATNYLLHFNGVGLKTAYCVLLFGLGLPVFPVDTHIMRVVRRLGLIPRKISSEKAHQILNQHVPHEKMYSLHVHLIRLGRELCHPRSPQHDACPLTPVCEEYKEVHENA